MVNARQVFSSVFVASLAGGLAGSASAEPRQTPKPLSDAEFREYRDKIEGHVRKCIRDKLGSPELCRMMTYGPALAAGWPPEEAERVTGYRPK